MTLALGSDQAPAPGRFLMRARRILIALSSLAVVAAGLTLTPSASADSVQVQSYQRTAQSQACAAQPGETPWEAAWGADSSWSPSWEQWANGGQGGWTCARSITWAKDSPMASSGLGCSPFQQSPSTPYWVDFGSGYVVPVGSQVFYDASCTVPISLMTWSVVWAVDSATAEVLCEAASPGSVIALDRTVIPVNIYWCMYT